MNQYSGRKRSKNTCQLVLHETTESSDNEKNQISKRSKTNSIVYNSEQQISNNILIKSFSNCSINVLNSHSDDDISSDSVINESCSEYNSDQDNISETHTETDSNIDSDTDTNSILDVNISEKYVYLLKCFIIMN